MLYVYTLGTQCYIYYVYIPNNRTDYLKEPAFSTQVQSDKNDKYEDDNENKISFCCFLFTAIVAHS